MIITELYKGQGFGNQLWSYVALRVVATHNGFDFGVMHPEKFKGVDFMPLNFGTKVIGGEGPEGGPPCSLPVGITNYYLEKDIWDIRHSCDVREYDASILNIPDNTKIEGYFQSEDLIIKYKNNIREWLRIKQCYDCYDFSRDNLCVLNVRGGDYKGNSDLILRKKYWVDAMNNMLRFNKNLRFMIITDDVPYAKKLLPELEAFHFNIGKDYSIIKNAKYLIVSNSSFSFFPAWLNENLKVIIGPKYWARHNVSDGYWACPTNIYRNWLWQDREGVLFSYDQCQEEYLKYKSNYRTNNFQSKSQASKLISYHLYNFQNKFRQKLKNLYLI